MTVYCYDTEFVDDGKTIELISIGIVCEDGREYYAVNSDMNVPKAHSSLWLMKNVWPHLPLVGYNAGRTDGALDMSSTLLKPKRCIANEVREFLLADGSDIELWAYYAAYDHVALAQLWGPMMRLPEGIPMWTHDLMQLIEPLSGFEKPAQSGDEHHALADARWDLEVLRAARRHSLRDARRDSLRDAAR